MDKQIKKSVSIGLYAQPTRIGITDPFVFDSNRKIFTGLPTEEQYKFYLKQIIK